MNVTAISMDEAATAPAVDVVVPVYNEEVCLERSVRRLHGCLRDHADPGASSSPAATTCCSGWC